MSRCGPVWCGAVHSWCSAMQRGVLQSWAVQCGAVQFLRGSSRDWTGCYHRVTPGSGAPLLSAQCTVEHRAQNTLHRAQCKEHSMENTKECMSVLALALGCRGVDYIKPDQAPPARSPIVLMMPRGPAPVCFLGYPGPTRCSTDFSGYLCVFKYCD